MKQEDRIAVFSALGTVLEDALKHLDSPDGTFNVQIAEGILDASARNGWFTKSNCLLALRALVKNLQENSLRSWVGKYDWPEKDVALRKVGLIMAGNLPLVGFHDFLTVVMSGHKAVIKLSSEDGVLLPIICEKLISIDPFFSDCLQFTERMNGVEAVIATGSNNSARYFEYYFRNIPHLIRKNRTSVAVLTGNESEIDLQNLGNDIFNYFGLGCRNVSALLLPKGDNINRIFGALQGFSAVLQNNKYANNYDYYRAVYALNKQAYLENGFIIMKEDEQFYSPVAVLNYSFYDNSDDLSVRLMNKRNDLQCIVGNHPEMMNSTRFGRSQQPELWDYADGADTMAFLLQLK